MPISGLGLVVGMMQQRTKARGLWAMWQWATSNNRPTKERERRKREGRACQQGKRRGREGKPHCERSNVVGLGSHPPCGICCSNVQQQASIGMSAAAFIAMLSSCSCHPISFSLPTPILCILPPYNLVDCQVHSPIIFVVAAATLIVLLHPVSY
jgi:hypothetical protein